MVGQCCRHDPEKGKTLTDEQLHAHLKEATNVYGSVSGWSKPTAEHRRRLLPGHRKLGRDLDALYVCRREVQRAVDLSIQHGSAAALNEQGFSMWQRACIRSQILRNTHPPAGQARDAAFWEAVLEAVRDAILA